MILKYWLDLHEAQEKLLKKNYMQYSVLLNKDQQKMVVKLFFLVSKNIFSNLNFFEFFFDEFIGDESNSANIAI